MRALLIGTLFWASTTFAQDKSLELMSSCESKESDQVFTLYRDRSDPTFGLLYEGGHARKIEHRVEIGYTNAGARAIVTADDLPILILVGTGESTVQWNGNTWDCTSDF